MIPFRGLRDAKHYTGSLSNPDNNYTERNITYDRNGNVLSMTRSQTSPQDITMTYSGNRLASYCDSEQFIYDSNGNCCFDPTTGLEYSYNFLNLPCTVLDGEEMQLHYTYFADGTKYSVMRDFNEGYVYVGPFVYKIHSDYDYPFLESVSSEEGRLVCDESSRTWRDCWFTKDHIGNVRTVLDLSKSTSAPLSDIIVEQDNYLPFGTKSANPALFGSDNRYRLAGNEEQRLNNFTTTLTDFGARSYNPTICRWMTIDPLAEKSHSQSPYNFCVNNPIIYIDFDGRDTVLVSDQSIRPEDSGPGSVTYTAEIYVIQQGQISGPYRGSSYPNSVSNTDNRPAWNTINSGSHNFNNASGHRNGTEQGLNI